MSRALCAAFEFRGTSSSMGISAASGIQKVYTVPRSSDPGAIHTKKTEKEKTTYTRLTLDSF